LEAELGFGARPALMAYLHQRNHRLHKRAEGQNYAVCRVGYIRLRGRSDAWSDPPATIDGTRMQLD
jgi:hypothetical protein